MYDGKALYNPQGRSGEYSMWAINFYNGCTGGCEYCYNKRFPLLSAPQPTLKKCFSDNDEALKIAIKEISENKAAIIKDGGVFLSFVSEPCGEVAIKLTMAVVDYCSCEGIPVMVLSKRADWVCNPACRSIAVYNDLNERLEGKPEVKRNIAFGFSLTGHDELEPGCDCNEDRITAMEFLREDGYRTFASIEPIIDFQSSLEMIRASAPFCDHFKIGLRTDKKFNCTEEELVNFVNGVRRIVNGSNSTVYFKRSFRERLGGGYIIGKNFVEEGFNMFTQRTPDYGKIFGYGENK